tara:strand:+ start:3717 stop:3950 length:234 start_codon:yes stop_codon:yes gene_type:complete
VLDEAVSTFTAPALIGISILSPAGIVIVLDGLDGNVTFKSIELPRFSIYTILLTVGNSTVTGVVFAVAEYIKGTPDI